MTWVSGREARCLRLNRTSRGRILPRNLDLFVATRAVHRHSRSPCKPHGRTRGIRARERWRRNCSEAARQAFFSSSTPTSQRTILIPRGNMKTAARRKWHAMLLAVMRTRVTLLQNWRAKLISLLLATTVWYLIKKNVETTPSPSGKSLTERVTKTP